MVSYEYSDLFNQGSIDKQVTIEYDEGTITNTELFSESLELDESLCSDSSLQFGSCEASILKFKVANVFTQLLGKWLTVGMSLNGNATNPFLFGKYKVESDKPTADRIWREVTAYDAMYGIINTDVSDWYNSLTFPMTIKDFRYSFFSYFGIEQEDIVLVNDNMTVEKTVSPSELSGKDVITAICQLNGAFGRIGRDGKFHYVFLQKEGPTELNDDVYINCEYEDYVVKKINRLQIRQTEDDAGAIYPEEEPIEAGNTYIVEDNFLTYGKSAEELVIIAGNLYSVIGGICFRPFTADCKGNPCIEVGDYVKLPTKYVTIESYIMTRTLKGIQALRDDYEADGEEEYSGNVNSVGRSIVQLKGKTNELTRTVDETMSKIASLETDIQDNYSTTVEMNSVIEQTSNEINLSVESKITETKEYTDSAVDAIKVGGRNLEEKTNQGSAGWEKTVKDGTYSIEEETWLNTNALKFSCEVASTSYAVLVHGVAGRLKAKMKPDTPYVLSIDSTYPSLKFMGIRSKSAVHEVVTSIVKTTEEKSYGYRYTWKFRTLAEGNANWTYDDQYIYFYSMHTVGTFYFANLKVEEGNIATDWTPAPEDVDASITTLTEKYAEIEQTANGLVSTVAEHNTVIDGLETRVSSAESQISQQADEIDMKVSRDDVISSINMSPEEVKISGKKIDLEGAVTFSSFDQTTQDAINSAKDNADSALETVNDLNDRANSGEFNGADGEDATTLRIESSRGTVFKNNAVSTTLSAVIYKGSKRITDITALREEYGSGSYLEWSWQRMDETTFGTILSTDSRIGAGGFTFTLSPDDVDAKVVFMCQLMV